MVYLKFDSVVSSRAFQKLYHPQSLVSGLTRLVAPDAGKANPMALRWAADSSMAEAECASPRLDSCFADLDGMDPEALGTLRAAIQKVALQWNVEAIGGFTARFLRTHANANLLNPNATALDLSRLELRTDRGVRPGDRGKGGKLILKSGGESGKTPATLCAADRCLDASHPHPPFAHFRNIAPPASIDASQPRVPQADFLSTAGPAAQAVLPGRIVEMPADLRKEWMKIYHGANVFSFYRGFTRMRPGLKNGSMVTAQDTLGFVDPLETQTEEITVVDASQQGLEVRIEKDGLLIDPLAWLIPQENFDVAGQYHEGGAVHGR
jgi:hypothetical protein